MTPAMQPGDRVSTGTTSTGMSPTAEAPAGMTPAGAEPLTAGRVFEPASRYDRRLALGATGALAELNAAGIIDSADVHVAATLARAAGETEEAPILAAALATRAVRAGSVAVESSELNAQLDRHLSPTAGGDTEDLSTDLSVAAVDWAGRLRDSRLVREGALVLDHDLVYLQRYHAQEVQVVRDLHARARRPRPPVDDDVLDAGLARVFPGDPYAEQRQAARTVLHAWTSILTGGPGTGKTTTVAGVLALLAEQAAARGERAPRVGLAAPTGKAAARIQEAVSLALDEILDRTADPATRAVVEPLKRVPALTLHRLLGRRPDSATRFRHDRSNRLPHDIVLIDESSMVSLTHMARLLEALRATTRLVLVGDADQLVSVDAGVVLADLVAGAQAWQPRDHASAPVRIAHLKTAHRFGRTIGDLAEHLRRGDSDAVMLALRAGNSGNSDDPGDPEDLGDAGHAENAAVTWIESPDGHAGLRAILVRQALRLRRAALAGEASTALGLLDEHRLLCAHREGPRGVRTWNGLIEEWLAEETGDPLYEPMYVGRPLLITRNDYATGVFNGDTGVVVAERLGGRRQRVAVIGDGSAHGRRFGPSRLGDVETMHAMTIHKSQGSQAREITVMLPEEGSALLTRELLYTAITRAQKRVRIVGSEAAVRQAVERRVVRASGLRQRLLDPGIDETG